MIFLLSAGLGLYFWIVALSENYDLFSPRIWPVAGFFIGAVGCALNYQIWGDIHWLTVLVIFYALIAFSLGSFFGKNVQQTYKKSVIRYRSNPITNNIHFALWFVICMNTFMIIVAYYYYKFMYSNSLIGGNAGGYMHMFSYARMALSGDEFLPMGIGLSTAIKISFGFAHVQTYLVIQDFVNKGRKSIRINDFFSICIFLVHTILSGGRTKMLYFIVYIIVVLVVSYRNKARWTNIRQKSGVKYILLGIIIGLTLFWVIDKTVRGSVYGTEFTIWGQLSKYISSPIYALDNYLQNPTYMLDFRQTETMYPLISILNKLGAKIPFINNALEFTSFGKSETVITNIYTAIRRYVHDFGFLGLFLSMFIQGILYEKSYLVVKKNNLSGLGLVMYAILVYPVAFYFIEERFLNDLFTLTMIFQVICVIIFWKIRFIYL